MKYCKNCSRFAPGIVEECRYCGSVNLKQLPLPLAEADPEIDSLLRGEKISFKREMYFVRKVIGVGGYGLVLEVEQKSDHRIFAMKVPFTLGQIFHSQSNYSCREIDESETSIRAEIGVLEKITSQRIIKVFETGEGSCRRIGGRNVFPVILMELAVCTLRDIVVMESEGKIEISLSEKLRMTACIVNTLKDLHDSGIIHRDIALENIFAVERADGIDYVLADFGTSRERGRQKSEKTTGVIGRDKYLDPMRFDKRFRRDPRIDIFTAGIVITEIFIGNLWDNIIFEPLYDLDFEREFLNSYGSDQIDKRVIKFISGAIKSDITRRYRDASVMKKKFNALIRKIVRSSRSSKVIKTIDLVYNIPVPLRDQQIGDDQLVEFENNKKIGLDIDCRTVIKFRAGKIYNLDLKRAPFFKADFNGQNIVIKPDRNRLEKELNFFNKGTFSDDRGILYFTGKLEIEIMNGIGDPDERWES